MSCTCHNCSVQRALALTRQIVWAVVTLGALIILSIVLQGCIVSRIPWPKPAPTPIIIAPPTPEPAPEPAPTPTTLPGSIAKGFPQGVPDNEFTVVRSIPITGGVVNEALAKIAGCQIGGSCDLGLDPQVAMASLVAELRAEGFWAGQHADGISDEIAVATACDREWEGFHAVKYPTVPGTDQAKAVWARLPSSPCFGSECVTFGGGSYRGNVRIPAKYCEGAGEPTPEPPVVARCPLMKDEQHFIDFRFKATAGPRGLKVDATPLYCGFPLPDPNLGFEKCGTKCCELGIDGAGLYGEVCQMELADPVKWNPADGFRPTENPYTIFLDVPSIEVCASWKGCRVFNR